MNYTNGAVCFLCESTFSFDEFSYNCDKCGGNLGITYDYDALKKICNKDYFEKNKDYSVWRYLPFLPVNKRAKTPIQVGWTPLYNVGKYKEIDLFIKDEGRNPSASLKDRASLIALTHALESGAKKITGASTGNAGSSMACLAASANIPSIIFVPAKAPEAKLVQLLIFGAKLLMVEGSYDDAFELCMEVSREYGWYNRNTGYNPYTREGKKTCAFEICEQLNWEVPDWVVVSVGDGNIISGLWKGFCDLYNIGLIEKRPKMAAIQSSKSNAIKKAVEHFKSTKNIVIETVEATTIADSISVNLPRDGAAAVKAVIDSNGIALEVEDSCILEWIKNTAQYWGIFGEPAGVTSLAGLDALEKKGIITPGERVVCVVTGNGLKDTTSAKKASKSNCITVKPNIENVRNILQNIF